MAGISGGHNAVEEVDPPGDPLDDVGGGPDPHKIPGLVRRHVGLHRIDDIVHHLCGLPHCQTADGVAVAAYLGNFFHMPDPQIGVGPTLIDSKKLLLRVHGI